MDSERIPARIIFGITELEESDVEKDIIDASRQGYEIKDIVSFLKAKYAGNESASEKLDNNCQVNRYWLKRRHTYGKLA